MKNKYKKIILAVVTIVTVALVVAYLYIDHNYFASGVIDQERIVAIAVRSIAGLCVLNLLAIGILKALFLEKSVDRVAISLIALANIALLWQSFMTSMLMLGW